MSEYTPDLFEADPTAFLEQLHVEPSFGVDVFDPVHPDYVEPVHTEPAHLDLYQLDSTDSAHPDYVEPVHTEPAHLDLYQLDSTDSAHPDYVEPVHTEPAHLNSSPESHNAATVNGIQGVADDEFNVDGAFDRMMLVGPTRETAHQTGPCTYERSDEGVYETTYRLAKGLAGEKAAVEWLASQGHLILDYKPDIRGTNQGGIDFVTFKNGQVYLFDNKALARKGNISSVSALTSNFGRNLKSVRTKLEAMAADGGRTEHERAVAQSAVDSIVKGKYVRAITNANLAAEKTAGPDGLSDRLENAGLIFVNAMKSENRADPQALEEIECESRAMMQVWKDMRDSWGCR